MWFYERTMLEEALIAYDRKVIITMKTGAKKITIIFMAAAILFTLIGCRQQEVYNETVDPQEIIETAEVPEDQPANTDESQEQEDSWEGHLDVITPDPADDTWYMNGSIYKGDNGHEVEVFFDDEGMLQFAVDGLTLYFTSADNFQFENNWRIYTCDDGTMIVYYPGDPAHLEISAGDYAGLYEAAER